VPPGRLRTTLRAGGFALLASCGLALGIVFAGGGFGTADLSAFVAWTLPFSLAIGAVAAALAARLSRAGPVVALVVAALLAAFAAVLWTIVVGLLLQFVLAFSFPVFPCWLAGGGAGFASTLGVGSGWRRAAVVAGFVAPLVVFVATATALLALEPRRGDEDIDVVAYFRAEATAAEIDAFAEARLVRLGGVDGVSADYGENALYIEFTPDATETQRDEVVRRVGASPLVVRIERNVPPGDTG
jgi:hypothetical protein